MLGLGLGGLRSRVGLKLLSLSLLCGLACRPVGYWLITLFYPSSYWGKIGGVGVMYRTVLIRKDQYYRLEGYAKARGVSVGQLVRAIIDAFISSMEERIDLQYYLKLVEEDPGKAKEYYDKYCPICGYKKFEVALHERLSQY